MPFELVVNSATSSTATEIEGEQQGVVDDDEADIDCSGAATFSESAGSSSTDNSSLVDDDDNDSAVSLSSSYTTNDKR